MDTDVTMVSTSMTIIVALPFSLSPSLVMVWCLLSLRLRFEAVTTAFGYYHVQTDTFVVTLFVSIRTLQQYFGNLMPHCRIKFSSSRQ